VTLADPSPTLPAKDLPESWETSKAVSLAALREDYFSFLARQFPALCLHDEFIIFPRLEAAWEHWFKAAQLEAPSPTAAAGRVAQFLNQLFWDLPSRVQSREVSFFGQVVLWEPGQHKFPAKCIFFADFEHTTPWFADSGGGDL